MKTNMFISPKTGMMRGPFPNSLLLKHSPLEQIAKMLDFEFPNLVTTLLDIVENRDLKENYGLTFTLEEKQRHLIDCFWAIAEKEHIETRLFFEDYRLYLNFFLQYPLVMGKEMDKNTDFSTILKEYRQIEISGNVAHTARNKEYYFIWSGELPQELKKLDEIIADFYSDTESSELPF